MNSKYLARERLLTRLRATENSRISLLVAPPGCGKTVLVNQYLQGLSEATLWFSIPENTNSFRSILGEILEQFSVLCLTQFRTKLDRGYDHVFSDLGNYLQVNLKSDLVVVFDDVQYLLSSYDFFRSLLEYFPRNIRFILIARQFVPLDYIALRTKENLMLMSEDFYFQEAEVFELAESFAIVSEARLLAERVWSEFHGWPIATFAALELGLSALPNIHEEIFGRIAEELYLQLTAEEQRNLLIASILDEITPISCGEILNIANPHNFLDFLKQKALFVNEVNGGFRFHDLFRQFLQKKLRANYWSEEKAIRSRLAAWHEHNGMVVEAWFQLIQIENYDRAFRLLVHNENIFNSSGNDSFYQSVIDTFCDEGVRQGLWITAGLGLAQFIEFLARDLRARRKFSDCIRLLESTMADVELQAYYPFVDFLKVRWLDALYYVDPSLALVKLKESAAVLNNSSVETPESFGLYKKLYTVYESYCFLRAYWSDDYAAGADILLGIIDKVHPRLAEISLLEVFGLYKNARIFASLANKDVKALGYEDKFFEVFEQTALSFGETETGRDAVESLVAEWQGQGRFHDCLNILHTQVEKFAGKKAFLTLTYSNLAQTWLCLGNFAEAKRYLFLFKQLHAQTERSPHETLANLANVTQMLFQLGMMEEAVAANEEMIALAKRFEVDFFVGYGMDYANLLELKPWNLAESKKKLEKADWRVSFISDFLIAYYEGNHAEMERLYGLESYVGMFRRIILTILLTQNLDLAQSLSFYKDFEAMRDRVQQYQLNLSSHSKINTINVYLLGNELIKINGVFIDQHEWMKSQNRLIFYFLLFQGPTSASLLSSAFWPDKQEKNGSSSLRKAIQWIREILGGEVILFNGETYQISPVIHVDSDINVLRRMKGSNLRVSAIFGSEHMNSSDVILELARGSVKPNADFDFAWLNQLNSEVEVLQKELLLEYANSRYKTGDLYAALKALDRLKDLDPYLEEMWRMRMRVMAQLGEQAKLALLYQEMRKLFMEELGILPSKETRRLYDELISDESETSARAG